MKTLTEYGQYCPIAAAAEIIAERWTPLILRGLFSGLTRFNELHASMPRLSSALLSTRLTQLESMQIIERQRVGTGNKFEYHLTKSGHALWPVLEQMGIWSQHWMRDSMTSLDNINSDLFLMEVRFSNMSDAGEVKHRRVVEIRLTDTEPTKRLYWMIFDGREIDVCKKDPGYEIDLWVTARVQELVKVWMGHVKLSSAIDTGGISLHGSRKEVEDFGVWFKGSSFQEVGLAATQHSNDL
ncbi:MAG: helix-turn-helix transcriptional regulator [Rhodobacteraceae bacterium]|nr:helix-turn-helix transcriptional regulator [Paracoccaceae bacterium]